MKIDRIDTRYLDFGAGTLRGVLSRSEIDVLSPGEIELAIGHIQEAARLIERFQRQNSKAQNKLRQRRRKRDPRLGLK